MLKKHAKLQSLAILLASIFITSSAQVFAGDYEISVLGGINYGSDLKSDNSNDSLSVDSGGSFGLGFAWQESPNGQGQILINRVSHSLSNDSNLDFNVLYSHFNGVAQFKQQNYVTTVGIGLGGAYFDANDSKLFPSATIAVGTKYLLSPSFAIMTELRAYATLTDEDSKIFCQQDVCSAGFDNSFYLDTNISVGLSYSF